MSEIVAKQGEKQLADIVRSVHRVMPAGLTIVTMNENEVPQGLAVSAFSSVSLDPPTVLVLVSFTSSNHSRFYKADVLGINIVATDQASIARRFAVSGGDKFSGIAWHEGRNGAPILDDSLGYFEIEVQERIIAHTHTIFIGRVLDAGVRSDASALIYLNGKFYDSAQLVALEGEDKK